MPVVVPPLNGRSVYFDIKTGAFTPEGLRSFLTWSRRIGGVIAPSNDELKGFADAAQAAADAAQAAADAAQSTATTAQATAVAASVAATNAQDDANTAQATADGAQIDATSALSAQAIAAGRVPYGSGASITSEAAFSYDATTNTLTVDSIKGSLVSSIGNGVTVTDNGAATQISFYGATAIVQPTTAGAAATFVVGAGTAVNDASTFDGYTLKQVVKALRTIGLLA